MNSANNPDDLLPPRATPHDTTSQPLFTRPPKTPQPQERSSFAAELSNIGFALLQFIGISFVALIAVGIALAIGPDWSTVVLLAVIAARLLFGRRD